MCFVLLIPVIGNLIFIIFSVIKYFHHCNGYRTLGMKMDDLNIKSVMSVNQPMNDLNIKSVMSVNQTIDKKISDKISSESKKDLNNRVSIQTGREEAFIHLVSNDGWFDGTLLECDEWRDLRDSERVILFLVKEDRSYFELASDRLKADETFVQKVKNQSVAKLGPDLFTEKFIYQEKEVLEKVD